jgi:hypothetical protein
MSVPSTVSRAHLAMFLAALVGGLSLVLTPAPSSGATLMNVTITVHNVWELDCDDNEFISLGLFETCGPDYYAKAFFPIGEDTSPRAPDDARDITPNWQLSGQFDRDGGPFPVRIQLWDHDSTSGDDLLDIASGDDNLDIVIDPQTGDFSGDVPVANKGWSTGSGDDSAVIYFSVTFGNDVDYDDDGIHDGLERSSIGVDKQGRVPEFGNLRAVPANKVNPGPTVASNPCQSTVLVENDWMADTTHNHGPLQDAIDDAVATFDAGDRPAPSSCPYAGFTARGGIQLIMTIDDQLAETTPVIWAWAASPGDTTAEPIRDANRGDSDPANDTFDPRLRPWFSYSLWAHSMPGTGSSGLCCADNRTTPDILITLGGFTGTVGSAKEQAGTFMHELGHALGLRHGGSDDNNCKPNYVSLMNYIYQFTGVPDATIVPTTDINRDGTVDNRDRYRMDFSRQALLDLDEDSLDETRALGTSTDQFFWDGDGTDPWNNGPINAGVNWDGDNPVVVDTDTPADVNFTSDSGCTASPPPGTKGTVDLPGYDDWANIRFRGPLASPGATAGVPPGQELDPARAAAIIDGTRDALSTADLSVTVADAPDPVAAGTSLTYTLTVRNDAPHNTAYTAVARLTLPADVTFASASPGCTDSSGVVTCQLGDLAPGATATRSVTVGVPADLVYVNGGPKTIGATVAVTHDGPDPDTSDNTSSAATRVVAVADLAVSGATSTGPLEILVGQSGSVGLGVTVTNDGPSSPMDADVAVAATPDPGLTVSPLSTSTRVTALAVGTPQSTSYTGTVSCETPGAKTLTLAATIAPKNPADTDPDLTNNRRTSTVTIDCVVPIVINIRPHGFPNSINLNTDATLAALTTRAGEYGLPVAFPATGIDVSRTLWGLRSGLFNTATPTGAREIHGTGHPTDSYELDERTRDRDLDLVLHFKPNESGLTEQTTEACLKGKYAAPSGQTWTFFGCDSVKVVSK